jgi:hypothetical protein
VPIPLEISNSGGYVLVNVLLEAQLLILYWPVAFDLGFSTLNSTN